MRWPYKIYKNQSKHWDQKKSGAGACTQYQEAAARVNEVRMPLILQEMGIPLGLYDLEPYSGSVNMHFYKVYLAFIILSLK